jgi:hypothetical protein
LGGNFDLGAGGKRRAQSGHQAGGGAGGGAQEVSAVHMLCHGSNCECRRMHKAKPYATFNK